MNKQLKHKNSICLQLSIFEDNRNQQSKIFLQLPAPCPDCNSKLGIIETQPPEYPHATALRCQQCNRFIKWLSKNFVNTLNSQNPTVVGGTK